MTRPYTRLTYFNARLKHAGVATSMMPRLRFLFKRAERAFTDNRAGKNFPNYDFVMDKLMRVMGLGCKAPAFRLSKDKVADLEATWQTYFVHRDPLLSVEHAAARRMQRCTRRWLGRRERAARRIQQGCHRWLWAPKTNDGEYGIRMRILMKDLEPGGTLYDHFSANDRR